MSTQKRISQQRHLGGTILRVLLVFLLLLAVIAIHGYRKGVGALDVTPDGVYTLSHETKELLQSLDQDVTIYIRSTDYDTRLTNLLAQYAKVSPHIGVSDIDENATLYYATEALSEGSVIVTNGEFDVVLPYDSLYEVTYNRSSYAGIDSILFCAEEQIDTAIENVSSQWPILYRMAGHNEPLPENGLKMAIESQGFHIKSLYLTETKTFPEDCTTILLTATQVDITTAEADLLISWLADGGNLFVATDARYADMPSLAKVLASAGMQLEEGIVVEGEPQHMLSPEYAYFLVADDATADEVANASVITGLSRAISATQSNCAVTPTLVTSTEAFLKPNALYDGITTYAEGDKQGQFTLAALSQLPNGGQLFWSTSNQCFGDEVNQMSGGANYAFLGRVLAGMRSTPFAQDAASIAGKNVLAPSVHMTTAQIALLVGGFLLLAVAIMCVGLGKNANRNRILPPQENE